MNKELKDHIDKMRDEELDQWSNGALILERAIGFVAVLILLFLLYHPAMFAIIVGATFIFFMSHVASILKQARMYINHKLDE